MTLLSATDTAPYICWPCFVVSATHTYGLISVDFCKSQCASSGRCARRHAAWMLSLRGTKRKWQGNRRSVSIAMVAQARLFIPRLMGWRLELRVPDWEKHVPVLLKTSRWQGVVSHHTEVSPEQVGLTNSADIINIPCVTSGLDHKLQMEALLNIWKSWCRCDVLLLNLCCHWSKRLEGCRMWLKLIKAVYENYEFCKGRG